ncbi:CoA ester lyase [Prauserella halophila]|uniref:CoA ester lyase n=1 Tax=Prauserella halophila TaxID=185641 RepID=A0ABN1WIX0_9PSEU|nr:CoA ester lyase [Prauserella halophila]MCP2238122.1 citrate lyase subunit beta / citryl-CoA lyase [Prauserella halophila]
MSSGRGHPDIARRTREATTFLFVPGDRPERFEKASASGADLVVLDLEDAVAPERKDAARDHVAEWLTQGHECAVRVNPPGSPWHEQDLTALAGHSGALMLPKADTPATVQQVVRTLDDVPPIVALVETALGVVQAADLAAVPSVERLAFGSFDLAAELGVDPVDREALAAARGALVLGSAAAGLAGPIDGVTADLDDSDVLTDDVRYARRLGFTGKLCVHPKQLSPVTAAFRPGDDEIRWARKVVDATEAGRGTHGAVAVDGQMVDKPVLERAHRTLRQTGKAGEQ